MLISHKSNDPVGLGSYRPDIDGLRAVAVLAVVAYHYGPSYLPGGFVGVDVFFVISGYLITGILARAFETQTFGSTLLDFYQRRVRRIFPAAGLVLAFCLLVGWLVLFPFEYESLGKHVAASAGFVQNIALWFQAGYFDTGAIQKPLLHFWSLAVEEQFYIFWPFALWFIMRRRWPVMATIFVIAALSFAWNIWAVWQGHDSAAFYWPVTRAWELMVGAWLAIGHRRGLSWLSRWADVQSWLGAVLITIGVLLIRPEYGFPGFWALLPVVGTALLINAGPDTLLNSRLLSWRPAVWIGLISYPLYLWHWVLLSLTFIVFGLGGSLLGHAVKVGLIALSFLLAWLTYRWVEKPLRRKKGRTALSLALTMAIIGGFGLSAYAAGGWPGRPLTTFSKQAEGYVASIKRTPLQDKCFDRIEGAELSDTWYCVLGDASADTWIMAYGDSHALSLLPALNRYGETYGIRVIFAGSSGCLLLKGVYTERDSGWACGVLTERAMSLAKQKHASAVILIERWTYYTGGLTRPKEVQPVRVNFEGHGISDVPITGLAALKHGLRTTAAYYQSLGIPMLVVEDNPQQVTHALPVGALRFSRFSTMAQTSKALNASAVSRAQHERDQATTNRLLEDIASKYSAVSTLNMDSALCGTDVCPWVSDGKFLYLEDDHLSIHGAMQVYPSLTTSLNQILGQVPSQATLVDHDKR